MSRLPKLPPYQRKKSAKRRPTVAMLKAADAYLLDLPFGTVPMDNQVAGHTFQAGTDSIGLCYII